MKPKSKLRKIQRIDKQLRAYMDNPDHPNVRKLMTRRELALKLKN